MFTRRSFLYAASAAAVAAGAGVSWIAARGKQKFSGAIAGANARAGHLMRFGKFPEVSAAVDTEVVIIGGGISGLSAGWWLDRHGRKDFVILELDKNVGGNSQSGRNGVSAYPWGAHYLPLPSAESKYVRLLLEELNVIQGYEKGMPIYDEYALCSYPNERVYFQGRWHEGLLPQTGVSPEEKKQFEEFFSFMKTQLLRKGKDGKTAFAIPLDESSRDPEILALDKISFATFLDDKGWTSKVLRWYVDYCCRDDYGLLAKDTSAWAGIHYFASRAGKAINAEREAVLTWPEGNGWLVKKLEEKLSSHIRRNCLAYNVEQKGDHYFVDFFNTEGQLSTRVKARHVIYAAPRFTAKYSLKNNFGKLTLPEAPNAPWVVANVTLAKLPEGKGHDLSWDNVSYYSPSLGYIVATHQDLRRAVKNSVITYYLPLTDEAPDAARRKAFLRDHAYWARFVADDLEKLHPGIKEEIQNIDVWVWGHGMAGPSPGYLWGENRKEVLKSIGNLHFAHSEMSGISIFEEAQYRGVLAAQKVLG